MGRKKKSLEQQIHDILEKYVDDVETGCKKAIDKGAVECKKAVEQDSPVADDDIIRKKELRGNALVEGAVRSKKNVGGTTKVFHPGYYAGGWAIRQDKGLADSLSYGKRIRNIRQPHLTHLLENGHKMVLWGIRTNGFVKPKPHIEKNGEKYAEVVQNEIDKFLKKGGKIKL